jgi:hypothetical protein
VRGKGLEECSDCSIFNARLGVQLVSHLNPGGWIDPWYGIGIGYEHLVVSSRGTTVGVTSDGDLVELDVTSRRTYAALPELIIQAGLDFGNDSVAFGPYVSGHLARFSENETEVECDELFCPVGSDFTAKGDIDSDLRAFHYWLNLGLRGTYLH